LLRLPRLQSSALPNVWMGLPKLTRGRPPLARVVKTNSFMGPLGSLRRPALLPRASMAFIIPRPTPPHVPPDHTHDPLRAIIRSPAPSSQAGAETRAAPVITTAGPGLSGIADTLEPQQVCAPHSRRAFPLRRVSARQRGSSLSHNRAGFNIGVRGCGRSLSLSPRHERDRPRGRIIKAVFNRSRCVLCRRVPGN